MCGIFASVNTSLEGGIRLTHRGPDQIYRSQFKKAEIDFYRLSITGGSEGEMPVASISGRWNVFLNGEIYNYKKLIEKYSLPFSDSDTRTIANGIEKLGLEFINNLRGMFACVVYDTLENRTYVFRDVLGEKPLYYSIAKNGVFFSSEFSALHQYLYERIDINRQAVACFFRFGYIEEPLSLDSRIHHLPKGVLIEVSGDNSLIDVFYFHEAIMNEVRDLSLSSVLEIVTSEVLNCQIKSSIFLSSGIDSRHLLKRKTHNSGSVVALSFRSKSLRFDESRRAKMFSKLLGVKHVSVLTKEKYLQNLMLRLPKVIDSPIADPSSLAYSLLFRKTHELGIKVAFTGHGIDELFWGYEWFHEHVNTLDLSKTDGTRIFWSTPAASTELIKLIESYDPLNRFGSRDPYLVHPDKWRRARAEITHSYLNCNGFAQLDRLGMRESVEPRVPFSDSRLYFWCQINGKNGEDFTNKREFLNIVQRNRVSRIKPKYRKKGFRTEFLELLIDSNGCQIVEESKRIFELHGLELQTSLNHNILSSIDIYKLYVLTKFLKGLMNENRA